MTRPQFRNLLTLTVFALVVTPTLANSYLEKSNVILDRSLFVRWVGVVNGDVRDATAAGSIDLAGVRNRDCSRLAIVAVNDAGESVRVSSGIVTTAQFIARWEGFRARVYTCPGGKRTYGYGHVATKGDTRTTITRAEALELLASDIAEREAVIAKLVTVKLTEGQRTSLISICFNIGNQAFADSTLLKKLNAGDYDGARAEFARWKYASGKVSAGLVKRRKAEAELFGGGK